MMRRQTAPPGACAKSHTACAGERRVARRAAACGLGIFFRLCRDKQPGSLVRQLAAVRAFRARVQQRVRRSIMGRSRALWSVLLSVVACVGALPAMGEGCSTTASDIATDRPDRSAGAAQKEG